VLCVIVAVVPGDKPVTVNTRLDPVVEVTATEPLPTVGVAHVYAELKFVIVTVKPSAVSVGVPKVGTRAAPAVTAQVIGPTNAYAVPPLASTALM